jgi:alpha-D-xyloside xylohydrolase
VQTGEHFLKKKKRNMLFGLLFFLPLAACQTQTWVAGWCDNSFRARIFDASLLPAAPGDGPLQALLDPPTCAPSAPLVGPGALTQGNLRVVAGASGELSFYRASDGATVLAMAAPASLWPLGKTDAKGNALYAGEVHFLRAAPLGEGVYGLGEHKTGRLSYGDGWAWQFEDSQRRATFADNSDISLPLYTSSTGYTFLWNLPSYGRFELNATHVSWSSNATPALDFWVSVAAPDQATPYPSLSGQLVAAIGRPSDLPDFATGFWQCKLRYRSQAELLAAAQGYINRSLPISVIVIDFLHWDHFGDWQFNRNCWPDPSAMVAELRDLGIEVMVSVWPQVEPASVHFSAMARENLLIRNSTNEPWYDPSAFTLPSYLVDATNPAARAFQWGAVESGYLAHGIQVYWLDACEPQGAVPGQMTFFAGQDSQVAMAYPRENQRTFFEGLAAHGVTNGLTLSRSAWIGSAAVGGAVWSGDIFSNWTSFAQQIFVAQNMAMSGVYLWTTDIGGFHSGNLNDPQFIELMCVPSGAMGCLTTPSPLPSPLFWTPSADSAGSNLVRSAQFFDCTVFATRAFPKPSAAPRGGPMRSGLLAPRRRSRSPPCCAFASSCAITLPTPTAARRPRACLSSAQWCTTSPTRNASTQPTSFCLEMRRTWSRPCTFSARARETFFSPR